MEIPVIFDENRRFIFSNWSSEDFVGSWGGVKTTIKAGEVREFPMYLAFHFMKHFVDREMSKEGKEGMLAIDTARHDYEVKTVSEVSGDTESLAISQLKEKIKDEIEGKKEKKIKKVEKKDKAEFEGIV